jgi:hypothetical protein
MTRSMGPVGSMVSRASTARTRASPCARVLSVRFRRSNLRPVFVPFYPLGPLGPRPA